MADTCRSCGAPIVWTVSASSGKRMPLNARPDPAGNLTLNDDGEAVVIGPPTGTAADDQVRRFMSHHATCPQGNEWRDRNRR